jgi:hypothetical protein
MPPHQGVVLPPTVASACSGLPERFTLAHLLRFSGLTVIKQKKLVGNTQLPINTVVSMGRCNTQLEVYVAEFKGQIRLRASIQRKPCPE